MLLPIVGREEARASGGQRSAGKEGAGARGGRRFEQGRLDHGDGPEPELQALAKVAVHAPEHDEFARSLAFWSGEGE